MTYRALQRLSAVATLTWSITACFSDSQRLELRDHRDNNGNGETDEGFEVGEAVLLADAPVPVSARDPLSRDAVPHPAAPKKTCAPPSCQAVAWLRKGESPAVARSRRLRSVRSPCRSSWKRAWVAAKGSATRCRPAYPLLDLTPIAFGHFEGGITGDPPYSGCTFANTEMRKFDAHWGGGQWDLEIAFCVEGAGIPGELTLYYGQNPYRRFLQLVGPRHSPGGSLRSPLFT